MPAPHPPLSQTPLDRALLRAKGSYPSQAEEITLARAIRAWLDHPDPPPALVRSGRRARDEFVLRNLRLVASIVNKRRHTWESVGLSFEDAMSHGVIGLQRACELCRTDGAYKMSTYATWWIWQALNAGIHKEAYVITVPDAVHWLMAKQRRGEELKDDSQRARSAAGMAAAACLNLDGLEGWEPSAPVPPEHDPELLQFIYEEAGAEHAAHLDAMISGQPVPAGVRPALRRKLGAFRQGIAEQ